MTMTLAGKIITAVHSLMMDVQVDEAVHRAYKNYDINEATPETDPAPEYICDKDGKNYANPDGLNYLIGLSEHDGRHWVWCAPVYDDDCRVPDWTTFEDACENAGIMLEVSNFSSSLVPLTRAIESYILDHREP